MKRPADVLPEPRGDLLDLATEVQRRTCVLMEANRFYGYDFVGPSGIVRLAADHPPTDEPFNLYLFNLGYWKLWAATFDAATPHAVVLAAVTAAMECIR